MSGLLPAEIAASLRPGSAWRQRYIQSNIAKPEPERGRRSKLQRSSGRVIRGRSSGRRGDIRIGDRARDTDADAERVAGQIRDRHVLDIDHPDTAALCAGLYGAVFGDAAGGG